MPMRVTQADSPNNQNLYMSSRRDCKPIQLIAYAVHKKQWSSEQLGLEPNRSRSNTIFAIY